MQSSSFELDVVLCSVSVIPFQRRSYSVCMSFVGNAVITEKILVGWPYCWMIFYQLAPSKDTKGLKLGVPYTKKGSISTSLLISSAKRFRKYPDCETSHIADQIGRLLNIILSIIN